MNQEQIIAAYHDLASSPSGQIVLADLEMRFGFTTRSMFERDDMSALQLAYREGGRSVLAYMGRMIETPTTVVEQTKAET